MLFQLAQLPEKHLRVVERIDRLRDRLRCLLQGQPRRWTGLLRRSTFARAIQGSNSIEGYHVTVDDAVAAVEGEEPLDERTEAWRAVTGYRDAMSYVLQLADDRYFQHNEGTIRGLHYMMLSYDLSKHPGRWRPGSIYVRREEDGATIGAWGYSLVSPHWVFLTGEKEMLYRTAMHSYLLVEPEKNNKTPDFIHSQLFVLVDGEGKLRGSYDGTKLEEVEKLMDDVRILLPQ